MRVTLWSVCPSVVWRSGGFVGHVINEVTVHRAKLLVGYVTVFRHVHHHIARAKPIRSAKSRTSFNWLG